MALRVNCTMCGASIPADDQAIRRGLVACDYCSTILRITDKGTEEYKGLLARREVPSGVAVQRKGPGEITIVARRSRQSAANFDSYGAKRGVKIGLAIGAVVGVPAGLILGLGLGGAILGLGLGGATLGLGLGGAILGFLAAAVPAVLIAVIVVAVLDRNLPPLRLEGGVIYPSLGWGGPGPLRADSVQQLYSVVARVRTAPGHPPFENCSVCAVTEDGKRANLLAGVESAEVALYVEEILEVEAGIFNLPVYGDVEIPRGKGKQIAGLPGAPPVEDLRCESCGQELSVTPEAWRRGFVVCEYCSGLVLLYEPGSTKPILGMPAAGSPRLRYRVEKRPGGLSIFASDTGTEVLRVDGDRLDMLDPTGGSHPLALAPGASIRVKQAAAPLAGAYGVGSMARSAGRLFGRMKDAMAYSGDVDPLRLMFQGGAPAEFEIVAREADGRETRLVGNTADPREALQLAEALRQALRLHDAGGR